MSIFYAASMADTALSIALIQSFWTGLARTGKPAATLFASGTRLEKRESGITTLNTSAKG